MAMQTKTAVFTGVEASVAIVWDDAYANSATFSGITTTDGSTPAYKFTGVTSAGLTVVPAVMFMGNVEVTQIEILP